MLDLPERELLRESLLPPDGYALDFAVATTYSLDLVALLTTPMAFSRWYIPDTLPQEMTAAGGMVLLNAVHEYASRMTVFCDAGRISVPPRVQPLLKFLEEVVIEVSAPATGKVFHPKVWALRYTRDGAPVKYRVLVSSRNLTFSRCWDTMLALDGELTERVRAFASNRPLADFFSALPGMARRNVNEAAAARIAILASELPRVAFDCPDGVDEVRFHPMGHGPRRVDPIITGADRILVVSPFVTPGRAGALGARGKGNVLVSTIGALSTLTATQLDAFDSVLVMNPDASLDPEATQVAATAADAELRGLHAKLYIADKGWKSHVYTGSANATDAAGAGNVEFLVELIGKRSVLGIDRMLRVGDREVTFRSLLQEFTPSDDVDASETLIEALDSRLERARSALARLDWTVEATPSDEERFDVLIHAPGASQITGEVAIVRIFPTTLTREQSLPLIRSFDGVAFPSEPLSTLTSLIAIELTVQQDGVTRRCSFVVNAVLTGAPDGRTAQLLASLLSGRGDVVRYLLILLGEHPNQGGHGKLWSPTASTPSGSVIGDESTALLEPLLRALDREPDRLEYIERFLIELRSGRSGESIPADVRAMFEPIMTVAREAR